MLYIRLNKIGEGTYGKVYETKSKNNEICVCKIIDYTKYGYDKNVHELKKFIKDEFSEFKILKELNHPNIIKFIDTFFTETSGVLVTELWGCSISKVEFNSLQFKSLIKQLASALVYLHENYIHRDLKPSNIVIFNDTVKIIDFGECISKKEKDMELATTLWYAAPEILLGEKNYTTAIDIWSLACVAYEKYIENETDNNTPIYKNSSFYNRWGAPPFIGDSHTEQLYQIFRRLGTPNKKNHSYITNLPEFKSDFPIWVNSFYKSSYIKNKEFLNLIMKMLDYTPSERITAAQILEHPFLNYSCK